jgi:hypothetical protein
LKTPSAVRCTQALLLAGLLVLAPIGLAARAQTKKNTPAPAAKTAAPAAKSAAPAASHSASGSAASSAGHSGTTTAHTGPTTAGAHTGPTTGSPTGGARTTTASATRTGGLGTTAGGRTAAAAGPGGAGRPGGATAARGPSAFGGHPAPAGAHEVRASNGAMVRTRPNGQRSDLHDERRGMDVHRGLNGERRVNVERADHSRVFAERGGRGFVQHPYMYRGHEFGRRTYYRDGRAYDRFYGRYGYHGAFLDVYAPERFYAPGFYGWAYNPWAAPINYSWGFGGNPWFGYYGAFYTPLPVYPSAAFWLTDYLISQSLAASYQAQLEAGAPAPLVGYAPITPDIQHMVADEVKNQLALENQEAQANAQQHDIDSGGSSIARLLSPQGFQPHVFVAGSSLDLVDASGTECAVSAGDVLEVPQPPGDNATAANAVVLTTKGGKECHKADTVQVAFTDLQDMQNHLRETVDTGLGDLQKKQGQGGLPPAPPSAEAPPVQSAFAAVAPPPDPNVATEIKQETQEADKAEQEVASATPPPALGTPPTSGPAAPVQTTTVAIGQSLADLTSSMGQPTKILDKGAIKIYVYPDIKVTVKNNKVTDIE